MHQLLTVELGTAVFFCDAHSPWQRGSDENINGLLHGKSERGDVAYALPARRTVLSRAVRCGSALGGLVWWYTVSAQLGQRPLWGGHSPSMTGQGTALACTGCPHALVVLCAVAAWMTSHAACEPVCQAMTEASRVVGVRPAM